MVLDFGDKSPHFSINVRDEGPPQFAVLTDEGQQVGTVQFHVEVVGPKKWGWYINGEIVGGFAHSQGMFDTADSAKKMLAQKLA